MMRNILLKFYPNLSRNVGGVAFTRNGQTDKVQTDIRPDKRRICQYTSPLAASKNSPKCKSVDDNYNIEPTKQAHFIKSIH